MTRIYQQWSTFSISIDRNELSAVSKEQNIRVHPVMVLLGCIPVRSFPLHLLSENVAVLIKYFFSDFADMTILCIHKHTHKYMHALPVIS